MWRRRKLAGVVAIALMIAGYLAVRYKLEAGVKNEKPEIVFGEDTITMSAADGEEKLLEGMSAYDEEDGDLSDKILIDSISPFHKNEERIVRYVVFDKNNQLAEAERRVVYTDYTEPEITLNGPLVVNTMSTLKIGKLFGASSCVDGDISNQLQVKIGTLNDMKFDVQVSVTDSTGTVKTESFQCEYNSNVYMMDIKLNEYLVRIPAGESYDFMSNINEITVGTGVNNQLIEQVVLQDNVDYATPGIYEVLYFLDAGNGRNGYTKCIVVVE